MSVSGNHISFSEKLQVPLSFISYSDLSNSPRLSIYWSILNSHTNFNLLRIRIRCLKNLAHSCVPPLEYTPVSRIPDIQSYRWVYHRWYLSGVKCEGRESSGRYFRIHREMTASSFWCVPFRGSFSYNSSDYQFYCFISLQRAMLCFKHLQKVLFGD